MCVALTVLRRVKRMKMLWYQMGVYLRIDCYYYQNTRGTYAVSEGEEKGTPDASSAVRVLMA